MTDPLAPLLQLGLESAVFLPIPRGEKAPRLCGWQKKTLADISAPAYLRLFEEDGNVGVLLGAASGNLCVIDIDADEWVGPFLAENPGLATTLRTRGSRGCSFWIRIEGPYPKPGKLRDSQGKDVMEWRADGQQSVIHGLHPKGKSYRILVGNPPVAIRFEDIVWPSGLFKPWETPRTAPLHVGVQSLNATGYSGFRQPASTRVVDHARRYLAKVDAAVSENAGHDQTFAAACILIKGFDLSIDEARPLLHEYNQRCVPRWEDHELEHKLKDAHEAHDTRARGYLIRPDPAPKFNADLPTVIMPGNGETYSESARNLFSLIGPTHTMFVRGNQIVELYQDDNGQYRLHIVSPSAFRSRAEKHANILACRMGRGDTPVLKPLPMPEETAKGLLATKEAKVLC
jgi:hypothetical protein